MKLTELNPRWFSFENNGPRVGLTFDCPCCKQTRLGVVFHERGHEGIQDQYLRAHTSDNIWTVEGPEDFNALTLTPSVDASKHGHWHGFVTNGEVT